MDYNNYHRDKAYFENESLFKNIFTKRFNLVRRFKTKPGRILDVGTSTGTMLDVFREHGWQTWGVEPSESARIAKEKGHEISKGFFEKVELPSAHFDVVMMNHTLEHLGSPIEVLTKVNSLLRKDGIVFVDVPNAGGLGAQILGDKWPYRLPDEHKHQFREDNLAKIFQESGFEVIHFESRSGIFEFADPLKEIFESLITFKKRFFINVLLFPYALIVTWLNMGDSMTLIGRKM